MSLKNYLDKIKRYFIFSTDETRSFIVSATLLAVVYSWNDWGVTQFELASGLKNLLFAFALISLTLFVHHSGQRFSALAFGLRAEQKLWWYGSLIALILVMVSDGTIKLLAATSTLAFILPAHRLGAFRYGPGLSVIMKVVIAGPLFNLLFACLIKLTEPLIGNLAHELFLLNVAFAWWNLLPIPPLDGSKIFYWSRSAYLLLFTAISAYLALIHFANYSSALLGILIGLCAWAFFIKMKWV